MKIALISCGRSDYSIYLPIIKKALADPFFCLEIIAFGTHVSRFYDRTVNMFLDDGIEVKYEIESLVLGDSPEAIASSMGLTTIKFSSLWAREKYDMIMVLGDRFEMFSAISASIPFNIPIAHLHGGEKTKGAFDEIFRHAITLMSDLHFVTTPGHARRVSQILGHNQGVFHTGAPALDNLNQIELYSIEEIAELWDVDFNIPTILMTYHPETVNIESNQNSIKQVLEAVDELDYQVLITMPNNDTMGTLIREEILRFVSKDEKKFKIVESLGMKGYYSCMKYCRFLLGNSSSGIIEAASFSKFVINIGDRQKGRDTSENVIQVNAQKSDILKAAEALRFNQKYLGSNIYNKGNASETILNHIKSFYKNELISNERFK